MTSPSTDSMDRLLGIMARLRGPEGCPWDREQTLNTLKPYLIEESYEVLEALDAGDMPALREELGDLLLQIVFQSQLCDESGDFSFHDVATAISDKLVRRHPHVFGDVVAEDSETVLQNWDAIKKEEKGRKPSSLVDGVPRALPSLARAREMQKRASRAGFDWLDHRPVREKVAEELAELDAAVESGDADRVRDEFGDVLFSMVNLSRFLKVDAEDALRASVEKFASRFRRVEALAADANRLMTDCSLEELDEFWNVAKTEDAAH